MSCETALHRQLFSAKTWLTTVEFESVPLRKVCLYAYDAISFPLVFTPTT